MSIDVKPAWDYDTRARFAALWVEGELPKVVDKVSQALDAERDNLNDDETFGDLVGFILNKFQDVATVLQEGIELYGDVKLSDAQKYARG